ncbi:low molecular weight protein-tyrosine-phosphatase [uncultured Nitrosomonas sp.]|uniref:low molecular weight protein-tyrosine-phosphatase n=1 Tax=uncultured Nitrosomonas sp. TaxID=156424 RepID=UPI00261A8943|nr:low molecular weight protein-tyrosine-phosphatase [uncultured Nitrosomonas sp.]
MLNNILIVCVGNICRSPMAEGVLRDAISKSGRMGYSIHSAGLGALTGHAADPYACQLMAEKGLDLTGHRARQLTENMIREADIVLVMEAWQKAEIEANTPSAKGKIFRLGKWNKVDIIDPYQKDLSAFVHSLSLIEQSVTQWVIKL